ncbi:MAG: GMC family oxidoreductase [Gemmatimonadota bacterium]|nr:GMC family oxidoreductase [Gemmatimonadota bacterium]
MELDARILTDGAMLEADLCIVGAGPAGLTLAAELIDHKCDVIVLESGGDQPDPAILALNDGDVVGDAYAGLQQTRHRQIGGTTCIWNTPMRGGGGREIGAKYAPLDTVDLEERPSLDLSGWPLSYAELQGYYERAQILCGLGAFSYDSAAWTEPGLEPFSRTGPNVVSRVYQLATRDALVAPKLGALRQAGNIRLCSHATVVRIGSDGSRTRVDRADVASPKGPRWSVRAKHFVLAAGAVENTRLLLASGSGPDGLGNRSDWVGRCFMEHPRDESLFLVPQSPTLYRTAAFYDLHTAADGTAIVGRLALAGDAVERGALPNASATLLPRVRPAVRRLSEVLGPLGRLGRVDRWLPRSAFGWSQHPAAGRVFEGLTVRLSIEQAPHPENRVRLGRRRDALGVPVAELHWRWRTEDQARLERLRAVVREELQATGIGLVEVRPGSTPDPNAHHHAGTTRMSADPLHGVVDPNGRVHSLDNLFVTGASVFPTAGFANPVLTIVALAVRLADHLKRTI